MNDFMKQITSDFCNAINKQKEDLIKQRLAEQGFNECLEDIHNMTKRKFPRMTIESHPNREEYWVDNGSIEGHLLITFFKPELNFDWVVDANTPNTLTSELKYK